MVYGDLSATDFFAIILIYLISPTERCFGGGYCFGVVRLSWSLSVGPSVCHAFLSGRKYT